jgi:hypothetical protein
MKNKKQQGVYWIFMKDARIEKRDKETNKI